jgi:Mannosylglycerate hydrolase MGH1-like glycoside hydrolase domain
MDNDRSQAVLSAERRRLEAQRAGREDWRLWGPYLAERAWGTVREDYSADGTAWEYFDHDQARSRAYRWNEDGLGGICDEGQRLCFALALWNGRDPILKERAFGLTGNQGNHGEDVKEYYFYLDATPSHSYLRYLYKYPQAEYPYRRLVEENARRSRRDPPFGLLDAGVFADGRYWDVDVRYAKAAVDAIHIRIGLTNHGPETATLHVLPTLWFRNTWAWNEGGQKPALTEIAPPPGMAWRVRADHPTLGGYFLDGLHPAQTLFTENESNQERLWGRANPVPYVKDAFHRLLIQGEEDAVNPNKTGTKFAACYRLELAAAAGATLELTLAREQGAASGKQRESIFVRRQAEAAEYYDELLPAASAEDRNIVRQATAGMIWNKQLYHYDVARWLDGDRIPPPSRRKKGRNHLWRHLNAAHVIAMPDKWEYPWFAAWDLAFHCAAWALIDVDFAKDQIELLLKEFFLKPNGQIPAYEWAFDDVNPPVLAMAALKVFRAERVQRGNGDLRFLQRVMHKLLLNYAWWLNRKDAEGHNVFEGGFLGLDNISVYDRSRPLPPGYSLKQADATGWMAMFALNMTLIALELTADDTDYEDVAIQCYVQFLGIANTIGGHTGGAPSLWDPADGFFKDFIVGPDGRAQRIDVFSWVGIIPLFACEIVYPRLLEAAPRFAALLHEHQGGMFDGHMICACPEHTNDRGERLFALVDATMLPRILEHLLSEDEFLSRYGIRSVSRVHAERRDLGTIGGVGRALIEYEPGESTTELFGGNSNWRGPVWMPTNYCLIQALEKFHRYLGDGYKVAVPCLDNRELTLQEIARFLADRLVDLFRRGEDGHIPALPPDGPFRHDRHWQELLLFHEYFHGDTGLGLGAMHQTGWTALVVNLVERRYRSDIPAYWKRQMHGQVAV